jgi:cell wall-associated NlpC family hydrolase
MGLDCVGLVRVVLGAFGLWPDDLSDPLNYGREPDKRLMISVIQRCERVPTVEVGCLMLILWPFNGHPTHLAFYSGSDQMIHCYERAGGVVEHPFGAPWTRMLYGLYRVPGVA